jgi:hypothetical protein
MLLNEGDKILVTHRRLFDKDETRYFVGRVDACEAGIVKVTGHSFVRDVVEGRVIGKTDERTKIFSLSSGTLIVYQLPDAVALDKLTFDGREGQLALTDGKGFVLNLAERPHQGHM